ncbi:cytochrome P450, partial [Mycena crocata]
LGASALAFAVWVTRKPKGPLPPGPKGIPIFGNAFQLPQFQWAQWAQEFGPIFSLNMAGQPLVVLNTGKVCADLMDRRSVIYSDRPRFIMAAEILTGGMLVGFARYGPLWRRLRKAAHLGLHLRAAEAYYPIEEREAAILVQDLLRDPSQWDAHIRRFYAHPYLPVVLALYLLTSALPSFRSPRNFGSLPHVGSVYNTTVRRINDLMHRVVQAALPGNFLVEIIPWMCYLPDWLAKWKRDGKAHFVEDSTMFKTFLGNVKDQVATGEYQPSFGAHLVYPGNPHGLSPDEQAWLAGIIFGAGSDSTAGTLGYFMLLMNLHPEVQLKAHEEIDRVVGRHRMPNFEDRDSLPYVTAIVKEVLRWHPVSPLGLPHRLTQDDWYDGYFLPEGTIVVSNIYGINRDPEMFPDPDKFDPDRYHDEDRDNTKSQEFDDTHGQGHFSYGFGRRVCVGMNLANNVLFINIVAVLWAVMIKRPIGPDGKEIIPDRTKFIDDGLVVRPEQFQCVIEPRGGEVQDMLRLAKERA